MDWPAATPSFIVILVNVRWWYALRVIRLTYWQGGWKQRLSLSRQTLHPLLSCWYYIWLSSIISPSPCPGAREYWLISSTSRARIKERGREHQHYTPAASHVCSPLQVPAMQCFLPLVRSSISRHDVRIRGARCANIHQHGVDIHKWFTVNT